MYDARVHSSTGCSCSGRPFQAARRCQGWRQVHLPQQLSGSLCYKVPAVKSIFRQVTSETSPGIQQQWHIPSRATRQQSRTRHTRSMICCQAGSSSAKQAVKEAWYMRLWNNIIDVCPPLGSPNVIKRALGTLLVLVIARYGQHVPLQHVDQRLLPNSIRQLSQDEMFGQHATVPANIFMLGIGPLINASLFLGAYQSLTNTLPKPGKEGAASFKVKMNWIALGFAVIQGTMLAVRMSPTAFETRGFVYSTMLTLAGGAAVLNFLAGEVENIGLGNGTTLLIASSILINQASTWVRVGKIVMETGLISPWKLGLAACCLIALVYAALFVSQIEKRYPLVSYKIADQGSKQDKHSARNYLPMRLTPSGMSPLLTASFMLQLTRVGLFNFIPGLGKPLAAAMADVRVYPLLLGALAFSSVVFDLTGGRMARDVGLWMSKVSQGVKVSPPVLPGEPTAEFLVRQQQLARFWGGIAVAVLAVLAALLDLACVRFVGVSFNAVHMLLLTGFVSTAQRQVASLSEIPRLQRKLARERELLLSFDS